MQLKSRDEITKQERWNVESFYPDLQTWQQELERAQGEREVPRWPSLSSFKGRLKETPDTVSHFFELYFTLQRQLTKLHTYAHLRFDEDLSNDLYKKNFGLISSLLHDFQLEASWVEPELLSLSEEQFRSLLIHPALQSYRFYLEKLGRMRAHVLSPELEGLLALSGKALETPYKTFGALNNVDLRFDSAVTERGERRELTVGTYSLYQRAQDRTLRRTAFEALHRSYEQHANTLCELIQGQVQSHFFQATARKFRDCREAALFPYAIDSAVYDRLIEVIHHHLPSLHEYISLRKKYLQLDALYPYDLSVSLVSEPEVNKSFSEACDLVIESVAPLGSEYQRILRTGLLAEGWVDPFENRGKRTGAYSSGCFDSSPYILMNYHGTFQDVMTLAHEAGHSMHSYLSHKHQPYIYSSYPIFVAEVASTFNEQLLLHLLKQKAKTDQERAFFLCVEIDGIRTTIFRQTLFAEFELKLHRMIEEGIPLTPRILKEHYLALNHTYYGSELVLDAGLDVECFRIPHFYYNFYVYQYATGLSAAIALFEQAVSSKNARDRYLQFLQSGGSRYPLDLLQLAGVDLRKKAPIEAAMKRFSLLMKELLALNFE
jgi:oligoendopeptidase F